MQRAQLEGLTVSELLQSFAQGVIYNTQPSVDEGYRHAKHLAIRIAHDVLQNALDELPETFAEAHHTLASGQVLRRPRNSREPR